MTAVHGEEAFEAAIAAHLVANGWVAGDPAGYRRDVGLDPAVLLGFVEETQPRQWARLVAVHGGEDRARDVFVRRVAAEVDVRGTVDVLRRVVEDSGVKFRLAFFRPGHALTPELTALYDANRLVVTRQMRHSESAPQDSVDLLLLVNGLPVATAELKNQVTGQTVEDAKRQYKDDRNPTDLIFARRTVVHFAVDQDEVFLTTRLAGAATDFLPFNEGSGGAGRSGGKGNPPRPAGYRSAYLWERVWQRDAWLDLLGRFVHEEERPAVRGRRRTRTGRVIFPRYHQWDVVRKLLDDAAVHGPGRSYLVQHSAGSGKSNSIAWLAHQLTTLHTPADSAALSDHARGLGLDANDRVFHKIVVVTDRVVLDRQLQDTISQFDHKPGMVQRVDEDSRQLADALTGATAQVIVTTLQKFPVVARAATDLTGKRFAVLVDEAHSSQSGEAAKGLRSVLGDDGPDGEAGLADDVADVWAAAEAMDAAAEAAGDPQDTLVAGVEALQRSAAARGRHDNLSFFAFTATPKAKTLELFGERLPDPSEPSGHRLEPFHTYSMRQAIEEGFILDVLANYLTYSTYFRLANGLDADDPEVDRRRAGAALARFVALHPTNLAQKAEVIVKHFREVTSREVGGRAKAMVVTRSRLHAVRYKQAIEAYLAEHHHTDLRALVAFSGKVEDPDVPGVEHSEPGMNVAPDGARIPEAQTALRFSGDAAHGFPVGDYQVLIVAEKYQTGFDEPLLHTMYVDKRLDGVKAVQTLSRLNRTAPGKDGTFVLDFVNNAEDIKEAFRPFYETSWTEPTDPNVLYTLRQRVTDAGVVDPTEMRALVAALLTSAEGVHAALYARTDVAVQRYAALDPDDREAFRTALRDYVRTYAFLGQVLPVASGDLEELYYYGKVLLARLPRTAGDGEVDIGDTAVLTHVRTRLTGTHDLSLDPGDGPGLPGMRGGGEGPGPDPDKVRLSTLIDRLNELFGLDLTDADQVWFDQQVQAAVERPDLAEVARVNTEENFAYVFDEQFADALADRHTANEQLFRMYFDKPEFQEMLTTWARRETYRRIRAAADSTTPPPAATGTEQPDAAGS